MIDQEPGHVDSQFTAIDWVLRATVSLQCLGNAWWLLHIEETPLLSLLCSPADIGGLGYTEASALLLQRAVGWFVLIGVLWVVVRPSAWVLLPLALLQLVFVIAMVRMQYGFLLNGKWLPPEIAALFPWASQSARIAAPVGLWMLGGKRSKQQPSGASVDRIIQLLRWAIAVTFCAHGVEAVSHYFHFVDLLIGVPRELAGYRMSQGVAEGLLSFFGVLDFGLALAVVTTRWRVVAYYMVLWGLLTAVSRLMVQGWDVGWYGFASRAPHFGLPLVVAIYWTLVRWSNIGGEWQASEVPGAPIPQG